MSAFFQWFYRLFFPRKKLIQLPPDNVPKKRLVIPIDNTSQEIELICHQIEQAIENIRVNIRNNNGQAARQTVQCQQLIRQLEGLMACPQSLDSK